jgi:hypothetical protein
MQARTSRQWLRGPINIEGNDSDKIGPPNPEKLLAQPRRNLPSLYTCAIKNFVADTICSEEAALVSLVHTLENLLPRGRESMFASR